MFDFDLVFTARSYGVTSCSDWCWYTTRYFSSDIWPQVIDSIMVQHTTQLPYTTSYSCFGMALSGRLIWHPHNTKTKKKVTPRSGGQHSTLLWSCCVIAASTTAQWHRMKKQCAKHWNMSFTIRKLLKWIFRSRTWMMLFCVLMEYLCRIILEVSCLTFTLFIVFLS